MVSRNRTLDGRFKNSHGLSGHPLYKLWGHIKERCYNKNNTNYKNYGGRGIIVCDEWKDNFKLFYDWAINNNYNYNLTIDRIDGNGNYEPDNCRFVTTSIQNRNKKKTSKKTHSIYIGVTFELQRNKWKASIRYNNSTKNLGRYINEVDAAIARDNHIINNKLEGFILNFPNQGA